MVPNAVTLANIAFGFLGIVAATQQQFERACILLFIAALCDMADGRLARVLDASSKFGMELDSLSDMVSFGIAPAVLIYLSVLHQLGPLGIAISVAYVLCGALRLARFNVADAPLSHVTFSGIPIPVAAGYVMSYVMVRNQLPVWGIAVGTVAAAVCMVSTFKVPKFRKGGAPIWMLIFGMATFIAFLARPIALTWHIWNTWNLIMVATNYIILSRQGWLRAPSSDLPKAA